MSAKKLLSVFLCLSTAVLLSTQFFISASAVEITEAEFYAKKQELIDWAIENGKSSSSNLEDYRMIVFDNPSTIIKGVSYLLIKPQTSWSGDATPYIGGSYGYLCTSPSWTVEFYNNSYYFDSSNNWKTLKNPVYSDVNIFNQSGSVIHEAVFTPKPSIPAIIGEVSGLVGNFGDIGTFFWGLFQSVLNTIQSNPIILIPVLAVMAFSGIMLCIYIIRKFGVKSK